MGLFSKKTTEEVAEKGTPETSTPAETPARTVSPTRDGAEIEPKGRVPAVAVILGATASIGGFMFGYESGQISGFLQMPDFLERFGDNGEFSAIRQGTIVGLLCIGTLFGCLCSAPLADTFGRRLVISGSAFFYIIGVIIEITSERSWVQFAMGRFTAGIGIGALSTVVPMYQSESIPKRIRGATVSSYQLLITLGIWTAYMVNYGTSKDYTNDAQWRIPNGLSALWAIILGSTILLLPESPRYAYRMGRTEEARMNMARLNGVDPHSAFIDNEIREIEEKLQAESAGGEHPWHEIFTGPRMLYRTLLGMVLQAGQQLTGANYFFYYGTTIFSATGLKNPYVTSIILGTVNVVATIFGLWVVENVGRRTAMMCGAAWMFMCLFVYSLVGHFVATSIDGVTTPTATAGNVMIVFTCLFIAAFATTWGPLVWAIVGELYPARYRATCMALATASNWLFNFIISFVSTLVTDRIDYLYGLVFGVSCFLLFWVVYFFMIETKDRSLEEIDTMYMLHVNPITSAKWDSSSLQRDGLVDTDRLQMGPGGRSWSKAEQAGQRGGVLEPAERQENQV
ncbi:hexose transporter hxt5 [Ascochyta rabiei]|uniref:Substrate-specific transmembrane transporter n=1 Tax=Didymella rabiei TaxID=5454 RepID=A0A162YR66_DIDRA|nr:hexose transporter hxt5 [Ascochyta rabiei]KZM20180.1 substrate-specific transmembrane transporter [Ascochyta rabiei]UPX10453.1 hexose transporter hxt5 [Ascochyta rabiei]